MPESSGPSRRALALALVLLLALAPFAGCIAKLRGAPDEPLESADEEEEPEPDPTPATPTPRTRPTPTPPTADPTPVTVPTPAPPRFDPPKPLPVPQVVVAIVDTGINPYHAEFRDYSPFANLHPSTYLPGYPADARELRLTLSAATLEEALKLDDAAWKAVEPGVLYWVPGTRVVGLVSVAQEGARVGFDDNGHGTMTASRAAGASTSLAPTARIVAIEGFGAESVAWAASQPWIDVQSNSWASLTPNPVTRAAFASAAREQVVVAASGNGVGNFYGGVGQPSFTSATPGAPGVIAVGGHDNGQPTAWSGSVPHVVADACWNWAADATTIAVTGPRVGSGTSSAAPYVAGALAALVLEARMLFQDVNVSHKGGVLAASARPTIPDGPLADGNLTVDELKAVLFRTANPRPVATAHDGELCDPAETAPYFSGPVDYASAPTELPLYYLVGYGGVSADSLATARDVLRSYVPLRERPDEDQARGFDDALRAIIP